MVLMAWATASGSQHAWQEKLILSLCLQLKMGHPAVLDPVQQDGLLAVGYVLQTDSSLTLQPQPGQADGRGDMALLNERNDPLQVLVTGPVGEYRARLREAPLDLPDGNRDAGAFLEQDR